MLELLFRSCWTENRLKRIDVRLLFRWTEGYRWDEIQSIWDEPLLIHGPAISCPAALPSSRQMTDLAKIIRTKHPNLEDYSVSVKCNIQTQSYQKSLGPAQWQLRPADTAMPQLLDGAPLPAKGDLGNATSLSVGEACAVTFVGYDGHRDFACCSAMREQEEDSVGESACKARMEEEEVGTEYISR
jgi:hypothetical protein